MTEFLVERYASGAESSAVQDGALRAGAAAEEMTREGTDVIHVRAIFIPEDETCFHLYRAACVDDVRLAAARAGIDAERIIEAVTFGGA